MNTDKKKVCMLFGTHWYPVDGKPKCKICPCGVKNNNTCEAKNAKSKYQQ